jgi:hypothetical protein
MNLIQKAAMSSSPEAEIISQIEALIRKLAAGRATESDVQLLHDLQKRRVELMRPKFSQKRRVSA